MSLFKIDVNSFIESILDWRNRLLADTGVQRRLARSLFTRWIAKKRARSLFDLTAGFVYSQTLYSCIKLDLLECLRAGPRPLGFLAEHCQLPDNNLLHLVNAAVALGLLSQRKDGRYALAELGSALLGNPGVSSMILHHEALYADLATPLKVLQSGYGKNMQSYWPYANNEAANDLTAKSVAEYSALMASSQRLIASDVLDAFSFERYQKLLDVGGGEGAFICAAIKRYPSLSATLLDLPSVTDRAAQLFSEQGISARATVLGVDMFRDQYPLGHDLITLVRVLHDHDDGAVLSILKSCRRALSVNGTLVIAEPMAGDSADGRAVSAYFHLYLLAMGSGRPRTPKEITQLLDQAGFNCVRTISTVRPLITRVIIAAPN